MSGSAKLDRIGKYDVLDILGQGGMGVVYRARDPVIARQVAIKVILDRAMDAPAVRERFYREARSAGALSHENVMTIYDVGEDDGRPYIVMELLDGTDLRHVLGRRPLPSLDTRLDIVLQVCTGLGYAHSRGVVHRDIKPENVQVTTSGRVKLLDFGIARIQTEQTLTQAQIGTPRYMSPEQIKGEPIDGRTDIFSFGVLLYEVLSGANPFHGEHITSVIYKVLHEDPPPPTLPDTQAGRDLQRVVARCLAKSPHRRYAKFSEVFDALKAVRSQGFDDVAELPAAKPGLFGWLRRDTPTGGTATLPSPPPPPGSTTRSATPPPLAAPLSATGATAFAGPPPLDATVILPASERAGLVPPPVPTPKSASADATADLPPTEGAPPEAPVVGAGPLEALTVEDPLDIQGDGSDAPPADESAVRAAEAIDTDGGLDDSPSAAALPEPGTPLPYLGAIAGVAVGEDETDPGETVAFESDDAGAIAVDEVGKIAESAVSDTSETVEFAADDASETVEFADDDASEAVEFAADDASETIDFAAGDVSETVDFAADDASEAVDVAEDEAPYLVPDEIPADESRGHVESAIDETTSASPESATGGAGADETAPLADVDIGDAGTTDETVIFDPNEIEAPDEREVAATEAEGAGAGAVVFGRPDESGADPAGETVAFVAPDLGTDADAGGETMVFEPQPDDADPLVDAFLADDEVDVVEPLVGQAQLVDEEPLADADASPEEVAAEAGESEDDRDLTAGGMAAAAVGISELSDASESDAGELLEEGDLAGMEAKAASPFASPMPPPLAGVVDEALDVPDDASTAPDIYASPPDADVTRPADEIAALAAAATHAGAPEGETDTSGWGRFADELAMAPEDDDDEAPATEVVAYDTGGATGPLVPPMPAPPGLGSRSPAPPLPAPARAAIAPAPVAPQPRGRGILYGGLAAAAVIAVGLVYVGTRGGDDGAEPEPVQARNVEPTVAEGLVALGASARSEMERMSAQRDSADAAGVGQSAQYVAAADLAQQAETALAAGDEAALRRAAQSAREAAGLFMTARLATATENQLRDRATQAERAATAARQAALATRREVGAGAPFDRGEAALAAARTALTRESFADAAARFTEAERAFRASRAAVAAPARGTAAETERQRVAASRARSRAMAGAADGPLLASAERAYSAAARSARQRDYSAAVESYQEATRLYTQAASTSARTEPETRREPESYITPTRPPADVLAAARAAQSARSAASGSSASPAYSQGDRAIRGAEAAMQRGDYATARSLFAGAQDAFEEARRSRVSPEREETVSPVPAIGQYAGQLQNAFETENIGALRSFHSYFNRYAGLFDNAENIRATVSTSPPDISGTRATVAVTLSLRYVTHGRTEAPPPVRLRWTLEQRGSTWRLVDVASR